MNDDYRDAFVRESREAIAELNNALLALESDPDDGGAMEEIFRRAHTLKGNFGAMGHDDAAGLAHAIEDLLDEMRAGELAVTPDVMDLVFAGVDRIEAIVDEIEADGEVRTDPADTVADLRAVLEAGGVPDGDGGSAPAGDASDGGGEGDAGGTEEAAASDVAAAHLDGIDPAAAGVDAGTAAEDVVAAAVSLADSDMAGVDAMLVLESLAESHEVLATVPEREAVEDGEFEDCFTAYVAATDPEAVAATLDAAGKADDHAARDVTEELGAASGGGGAGEAGSDRSEGAADGTDGDGDDAGAVGGAGVDEIKSVSVDVDRLDELHGQVEQLVTSRIKLRRAVDRGDLDDVADHCAEIDKVTGQLQNTVMDVRLVPLKKVVRKLPRLVRDLARELDKPVEFTMEGEDVELDRTILTEIGDPLMHVLRNAVDHGIEPPEERERAGKPRTGHVELRATRERDHVVIEVEDDGGGLDVEAIERKAVEAGVRSPEALETMDDDAVYDLIFHPGFSTADEVTDTSGRGVGMDVVHDTVTQLDGSVDVSSTPGEGTTVSLRLPVTMAIVKVLFVRVGDEEYGVPLKHVDEITRADDCRLVNGREVVRHDGDLYPVVDLAAAFDVPGAGDPAAREAMADGDGGARESRGGADEGIDAETVDDAAEGPATAPDGEGGMLVRIRPSERQIALRCDAVEDQEEVVVKPLEGLLSGTAGLSGTAVLGDGNIVHILDVMTL